MRTKARIGVLFLAAAIASGGIVGSIAGNLEPRVVVALAAMPHILTAVGAALWWDLFAHAPRLRLVILVLMVGSAASSVFRAENMGVAPGEPASAATAVRDSAMTMEATLLVGVAMVVFAHLAGGAFQALGHQVAARRWRFMRWVYGATHTIPVVSGLGVLALVTGFSGSTVITGVTLAGGAILAFVAGLIMIGALVFEIMALWSSWNALAPESEPGRSPNELPPHPTT